MYVTIFATHQCNMRCNYCFLDFNDSRISHETLRRIFYWSKDQYNGSPIEIGILGGEPLLVFDELKGIPELINEINKNKPFVAFSPILTNGTLLNEQIVEFLKHNAMKLSFSLDGVDFESNTHRFRNNRRQFNSVIRNIKMYRDAMRTTPMIALTIMPDKAHLLYQNVKNFIKQGFDQLSIYPATGLPWTSGQATAYSDNFQMIIKLYRKLKTAGKNCSIYPINVHIKNIQENQSKKYHCGIGENISFSSNGNAYACELAAVYIDKSIQEKFYLGNIYTSVDLLKNKSLQNYHTCDHNVAICRDQYPASSCKKFCTTLNFSNQRSLSDSAAQNMLYIENRMYTDTLKINFKL